MLTYYARNLSEDCSTVLPGSDVKVAKVDAETALDRLRAFASLPAMAGAESDARIYLSNGDIKVAVQNENGRLFAQLVPEAANTAFEQTPEEIVGLLTGEHHAPSPPLHDEAPESTAARPRKFRVRLNSRWTLALLAVGAAAIAYFSFSPDVPAGIKMIGDPARVASLHTKFSGRYGEKGQTGQTVLLVASGRFVVYPAGDKGTQGEPLLESSYRYGLRGDEVVLVVANGAVLEPGADGSLKFNDSVYPRLSPPH